MVVKPEGAPDVKPAPSALEQRVDAADRGETAVAPAGPVAPAPAAAALVDPAEEWKEAVRNFAPIIGALLPEACAARLKEPDRLERIGVALARCAAHYGWKPGFAGHPLLGLAGECFPVAEPVVVPLIKAKFSSMQSADRAANEEAAERAAREAEESTVR